MVAVFMHGNVSQLQCAGKGGHRVDGVVVSRSANGYRFAYFSAQCMISAGNENQFSTENLLDFIKSDIFTES
jgi:hypothetical protein